MDSKADHIQDPIISPGVVEWNSPQQSTPGGQVDDTSEELDDLVDAETLMRKQSGMIEIESERSPPLSMAPRLSVTPGGVHATNFHAIPKPLDIPPDSNRAGTPTNGDGEIGMHEVDNHFNHDGNQRSTSFSHSERPHVVLRENLLAILGEKQKNWDESWDHFGVVSGGFRNIISKGSGRGVGSVSVGDGSNKGGDPSSLASSTRGAYWYMKHIKANEAHNHTTQDTLHRDSRSDVQGEKIVVSAGNGRRIRCLSYNLSSPNDISLNSSPSDVSQDDLTIGGCEVNSAPAGTTTAHSILHKTILRESMMMTGGKNVLSGNSLSGINNEHIETTNAKEAVLLNKSNAENESTIPLEKAMKSGFSRKDSLKGKILKGDSSIGGKYTAEKGGKYTNAQQGSRYFDEQSIKIVRQCSKSGDPFSTIGSMIGKGKGNNDTIGKRSWNDASHDKYSTPESGMWSLQTQNCVSESDDWQRSDWNRSKRQWNSTPVMNVAAFSDATVQSDSEWANDNGFWDNGQWDENAVSTTPNAASSNYEINRTHGTSYELMNPKATPFHGSYADKGSKINSVKGSYFETSIKGRNYVTNNHKSSNSKGCFGHGSNSKGYHMSKGFDEAKGSSGFSEGKSKVGFGSKDGYGFNGFEMNFRPCEKLQSSLFNFQANGESQFQVTSNLPHFQTNLPHFQTSDQTSNYQTPNHQARNHQTPNQETPILPSHIYNFKGGKRPMRGSQFPSSKIEEFASEMLNRRAYYQYYGQNHNNMSESYQSSVEFDSHSGFDSVSSGGFSSTDSYFVPDHRSRGDGTTGSKGGNRFREKSSLAAKYRDHHRKKHQALARMADSVFNNKSGGKEGMVTNTGVESNIRTIGANMRNKLLGKGKGNQGSLDNSHSGLGTSPSTALGASPSTSFGASPSTVLGANRSSGLGASHSTGLDASGMDGLGNSVESYTALGGYTSSGTILKHDAEVFSDSEGFSDYNWGSYVS